MILKENNIRKKKALLCTYNLNNYVLVRYRELLSEYEIIGIDIPGVKFLKNRDWAYLYMGENLGKSFSEKYDEDYEVVILGDGTQDYDFSILEKKVREFSRVGKDICMLYELSEKHAKILLKLCLDNSVNFYTHTGMKVDFPKVEIDDNRIFEMDVPVILVVGITEQTKKLDCVLNVKSHFEKCGYKVSAIGSKKFSDLFGIHAFPEFMYGDMREDKKILYFNAICKNIEYFEKPDIFVIGVPGGVVSYNSSFTNFFGILPYEISQAVEPDHVITIIPYGEYDKKFFEEIAGMVKYKLGCENISYGMTNCFIDLNSSKQENKVQYCNLRFEDLEKKIKNIEEKKVYNVLSDKQLTEMTEEIIEELSYS